MILHLLIAVTMFLASESVQPPLSPLVYFGSCMQGPNHRDWGCWGGWVTWAGEPKRTLVPCCIRADGIAHRGACWITLAHLCDGFDIDGDNDIDLKDYAWLLRAQTALEVQDE